MFTRSVLWEIFLIMLYVKYIRIKLYYVTLTPIIARNVGLSHTGNNYSTI